MKAFFAVFDFIPGWLWAAILAGAISTSCIKGVQLDRERANHATTKTEFAQAREAAARTALILSERNRQTEKELQDAKTENDTQASALLAAIEHAAVVAATADRRLRDAAQDAADAARSRCAASPASPNGPPGGDPIGVLAFVLGRADERAGELARIADESRVRGLACERAYDTAREALNR